MCRSVRSDPRVYLFLLCILPQLKTPVKSRTGSKSEGRSPLACSSSMIGTPSKLQRAFQFTAAVSVVVCAHPLTYSFNPIICLVPCRTPRAELFKRFERHGVTSFWCCYVEFDHNCRPSGYRGFIGMDAPFDCSPHPRHTISGTTCSWKYVSSYPLPSCECPQCSHI